MYTDLMVQKTATTNNQKSVTVTKTMNSFSYFFYFSVTVNWIIIFQLFCHFSYGYN